MTITIPPDHMAGRNPGFRQLPLMVPATPARVRFIDAFHDDKSGRFIAGMMDTSPPVSRDADAIQESLPVLARPTGAKRPEGPLPSGPAESRPAGTVEHGQPLLLTVRNIHECVHGVVAVEVMVEEHRVRRRATKGPHPWLMMSCQLGNRYAQPFAPHGLGQSCHGGRP